METYHFLSLFKKGNMEGVAESWCHNRGVAVLPFIKHNNKYYFLTVIEYNDLFPMPTQTATITGGCESDPNALFSSYPLFDALRELNEETGIELREAQITDNFYAKARYLPLVNVHPNQASATRNIPCYFFGRYYANKTNIKQWNLFAFDLTNLNLDVTTIYKGKTDGSVGEKNLEARFIPEYIIDQYNDTLAITIYGLLQLNKILERS